MKKSIMFSIVLSLSVTYASAQTLTPSGAIPVADGTVSSGEYSWTGSYSNMTLSSALSMDGKILYIALEAPTTGWVAVGLGSLKMDGAFLVLGYDAKGTIAIREDTGKGNSHKENTDKILIAGAVLEANGITRLEFALPSERFTGENPIKMILSYGRVDNFTSIHAKFAKVEVPLAK